MKSFTTTSSAKAEFDTDTCSFHDEKPPKRSMSGIALTGGANPFASHKTEELESSSHNESSSMADSLKGGLSGVGNTVSSGASQVSSGAQQAGGQFASGAHQAGSTASSGAQQAASTAGSGAEKVNPMSSDSTGAQDWEAMTEEQKKATYDALPEDQKHKQGYYEWIKQGLYNKKENWMPWIEDQYLRWFTSDNKASYATKGNQYRCYRKNLAHVTDLVYRRPR